MARSMAPATQATAYSAYQTCVFAEFRINEFGVSEATNSSPTDRTNARSRCLGTSCVLRDALFDGDRRPDTHLEINFLAIGLLAIGV